MRKEFSRNLISCVAFTVEHTYIYISVKKIKNEAYKLKFEKGNKTDCLNIFDPFYHITSYWRSYGNVSFSFSFFNAINLRSSFKIHFATILSIVN